eukprot:COSAG06_NODE_9324_length_1929_cov_1.789617_2_plen_356_part_00
MNMETDPQRGEVAYEPDRKPMLQAMAQLASDSEYTKEAMSENLSNLTRKAFAGAAERQFQTEMELCSPISQSSANLSDVLDLGHQLALLWASTDCTDRAQDIFETVLTALRELPHDWDCGKVARLDRTTAKLVKVLLAKDSTLAHDQEKECLGELAVSFEGVSIEFLANFVEQHNSELNFLSTDAVVERLIKPASRRLSETYLGKPFIETIHDGWKGKLKQKGRKNFFLSHAWKQTFHVSGVEWRGGAVQALIDSVPKAEHASTFVWFDIFCVNQHMETAAYNGKNGSLYAFAFDPLRNAIAEADHVRLFYGDLRRSGPVESCVVPGRAAASNTARKRSQDLHAKGTDGNFPQAS